MDLGVGILISLAFAKIFGMMPDVSFILVGALFSLVPDLDVFVELAKRGKIGGRVQGHHRELTHFPLSYIPVIFLIYLWRGPVLGWLFSLTVLAHFLHDSVGMGWGIQWLWPFSNRAYKFFSEKDGSFSKNFVVSWQSQELKEVIAEYGDDHWFKNYYLNPHPIAIFEFLVFILAFLILYIVQ